MANFIVFETEPIGVYGKLNASEYTTEESNVEEIYSMINSIVNIIGRVLP